MVIRNNRLFPIVTRKPNFVLPNCTSHLCKILVCIILRKALSAWDIRLLVIKLDINFCSVLRVISLNVGRITQRNHHNNWANKIVFIYTSALRIHVNYTCFVGSSKNIRVGISDGKYRKNLVAILSILLLQTIVTVCRFGWKIRN